MVPVLEPWLVTPAPALGASTRADSFPLLHLHQQTSILAASKCFYKNINITDVLIGFLLKRTNKYYMEDGFTFII